MASRSAIWGIDIGQCALKALRCLPHDDPTLLHADAFDYIEYPKILSQPEANPAELIAEALKEFLSRNSVRGDRVAISVAGQAGLARFIKLPPVESKKIPDIVKYEARQQIPFALEDVVWDYQQLAGGSVEEGFALETEVGLFAMKRDQVDRALKPFHEAGLEIDIVQLAPLALYNFAAFDLLKDLPPPDEFDPDNPPESTVLLSLGTDTTDLVVTNGYRVWQRSVPIGGNHFTRALTKELKLTYAKAEHLKRNAAQAEDPKALFQAMRSVFNDLLTEVQRSLGYFTSLDREAKIGRIVALGNTIKMPGLQRYLTQNLGHEVVRLEAYSSLEGPDEVVAAPAFKENLLSFATCYGLCVQGLADARIRTNLVPQELVRERMIREKKPWAVGAAAALLLGATIACFGHWRAWSSTHEDLFGQAESSASMVARTSSGFKSQYEEALGKFRTTDETGQGIVHSVEGRRQWLDLLTAINACLPHDADREEKKIYERDELYITQLDSQEVQDLGSWFSGVQQDYQVPAPLPAPGDEVPASADPAGDAQPGDPNNPTPGDPAAGGELQPGDPNAVAPGAQPGVAGQDPNQPGGQGQAAPPPPPSGSGWVIQLVGHHYHNVPRGAEGAERGLEGRQYVFETLIRNLSRERIELPDGKGEFPVGELGISHPLIVGPIGRIENEEVTQEEGAGLPPKKLDLRRFDFVVQFCWQPPQPEAANDGSQPPQQPY